MSWVAVAVGGSAALGAYGVSQQANAAKKAANASKDATNTSIEAQREAGQQAQAMLMPFTGLSRTQVPSIGMSTPGGSFANLMRGVGNKVIGSVNGAGGIGSYNTPASYTNFENLALSPTIGNERAYLEEMAGLGDNFDPEQDAVFRAIRDQMERYTNRSQAAGGKLYSSNTEDIIARNLGSLIGDSYNRSYSRLGDLFGMENTLSGQRYARAFDLGNYNLNATQAAAGNITGTAGNIGNLNMQGAGLYGNAKIAQGQANANMWGGLGDTLGTFGMMKGLKLI